MGFSLNDLTPDRTPFDLGDGNEIYFQTTDDFDIPQLAMWNDIRQRMTRVSDLRRKARRESEHIKAARLSDQAALDAIHLVLPDLPETTINDLTSGQIDHLAAICIMVCAKAYKQGPVTDESAGQIKERFEDLPDSFVASLTQAQADELLGIQVIEGN